MRIDVIGCGSIGQRHCRNLIALGVPAKDITGFDFDAEALSRLPDGVAREHGTVKPDAVLICTPAHAHEIDIAAAVAERTPFYVEKPAVSDSSQLSESLLAAADAIPHMVGYQWRFNNEVRWLREVAHPRASLYFFCKTNIASWPGRYGDPLLECSHEIDLARSLMDQPTFQSGARQRTTAQISLKGRDRQASIMIDWAANEVSRDVMLADPSGAAWRVMPSTASIDQSYVDTMAAFLAMVKGFDLAQTSVRDLLRHNGGCSLREALEVVKVCEWTSAKVIA